MSEEGYAVSKNGPYYCRAVDSKDEVTENEYFSKIFVPYTPTTDDLFTALRLARDTRLDSTDKLLLPDYPISADSLALVKVYRAALRDLPDQTGAPWDGGGEGTPWPAKPSVE